MVGLAQLILQRAYFKPCRDIFSITLMGEEIYIATSAADVQSIYNDTRRLDFDVIIRSLLTEHGMTVESLEKLFARGNAFGARSWMDQQHDIFRSQMHPGQEKGDVLERNFLDRIAESLHWERLTSPMILSDNDASAKLVSLWKWCGYISVDAAMRAFYGEALFRIQPDFVKKYLQLEDEFWALKSKYRLGQSRSKKAFVAAQKHATDAFTKWLSLPKNAREDACWMVKKIEQDFEELGMDDKSQLSALFFAHSIV